MKTSEGKKAAEPAAGNRIQMRMYNVGFGDCFLLRIPTSDGERRMLVDCGYHTKGKGKFTDKQLVERIKKDLRGDPLDVVVATHRHQDHISGFGETDLWKGIPVEEVWLPFTVNPDAADDEPALRAWHGLMDAADAVVDKKGRLTKAAAEALGARDSEERAAAAFMLWNARTNAPGIANLLSGLKRADGKPSRRRFLPESRKRYPARFLTPALPGVITHVLGPPADPAFRKNKKVPASWGFGDGSPGASSEKLDSVFSSEWQTPAARLPGVKPFIDKTLRQIGLFNDDLLYAATALEGFLNGESLVLVLEIGKARLLLPGDAEVGAWTTILGNADALAIAAGATFVKIGHHGSHNATPLVFVREHLAEAIPAVISTQQGDGTFRNGIPLKALLDTMGERKMPFARSDQPPAAATKIFEPDPGEQWVDCSIPC